MDCEKEIIEIKQLIIQLIELIKVDITINEYKNKSKYNCEQDCSSFD